MIAAATTPLPINSIDRYHRQAPSFAELRPLKGAPRRGKPTGFPVYPDLVDKLCAVKQGAHDVVANHVCSVLSAWSYSQAETVQDMMVRLGLQKNRMRFVGVYNDAMFIWSTAHLIQSECGRVVLLNYRGTEPVNVVNWLTDLDVNPTTLSIPKNAPKGTLDGVPGVHAGFYRNQRSTWFDVVEGLKLAADGRSILGDGRRTARKMEALYVTGHSLGGAMAGIAAFRIAEDSTYARFRKALRGVYTYGQPMIGGAELVARCKRNKLLRDGVFRHVYEKDVVPVLPPLVTGRFEHFGRQYVSQATPDTSPRRSHWTKDDRELPQLVLATEFVLAGSSLLTEQVPFLKGPRNLLAKLPVIKHTGVAYSVYDHLPSHYVETSQPAKVISEFGDF